MMDQGPSCHSSKFFLLVRSRFICSLISVSTTNEWLQKMGENHRQTNITEPMESHVRENEGKLPYFYFNISTLLTFPTAELLKTYSVSMTEAERRKLEESCQGLGSEEDDEDTPGVSTTLPEVSCFSLIRYIANSFTHSRKTVDRAWEAVSKQVS